MTIQVLSTGLLFADDFARADGAVGKNYADILGNWQIVGGKLSILTTATNHGLSIAAIGHRKDIHIQASITRASLLSYAGVIARVASNFYYFADTGASTNGDADKPRLYSYLNGAYDKLAVGATGQSGIAGATALLQLSALGNPTGVRMGVNGTQVSSFTDSRPETQTLGEVRLFVVSDGTTGLTVTYDNLVITTGRVVVANNLPAGARIRAGGVGGPTSAVAVAGLATLDLLDVAMPCVLDVIDGSATVFDTVSGIYGGDEVLYSAAGASGILLSSTGLLFADDFARADGAVGSNYSVEGGTVAILDGELSGTFPAGARCILKLAAFADRANWHWQLVARRTDLNTYAGIRWRRAGGNILLFDSGSVLDGDVNKARFYKGVGATFTNLGLSVAGASGIAGATTRYTGSSIGTDWRAYVNGAQIMAVTDAAVAAAGDGYILLESFGFTAGRGAVKVRSVIVCATRMVTITDVPSGYRVQIAGLLSAVSNGVDPVSVDLLGTELPARSIALMNGAGRLIEALVTPVYGGDTFTAATPSIPDQPTITTTPFPFLTSSAFGPHPAGNGHRASQWQITLATDVAFAAVITDSGTDLTQKTAYSAPHEALPKGVALIARVRHQAVSLDWSPWSIAAGISAIPAVWAIDYDALTVSNLTNVVNYLTDLSGGGVAAVYDNLGSWGYINLPAPVDRTKPFMFAALLEYHGSTHTTQVNLIDPSDTSYRGFSVAVNSGNLNAATGISTHFRLAAPASGARVWVGIAWLANGRAMPFSIPVPNGPLGDAGDYLGPPTRDLGTGLAKTFSGGDGMEAWANMTRILVYNESDSTRVLSVVARQGTLSRGPAMFNPTIAGDDTPLLRVPPFTPAGAARDLVVVFHGAGSSEAQGSDTNATDGGVAVASLVAAGYLVATMRGTDDGLYGGAKASNFGASAPLITFWKAWIDEIKLRYNIQHVFFIGQSMGLVNALNMHALYPALATAIVGISGLDNLAYAYQNEGFAALINAAYGTSTVGAIAGYDPVQRPALYTLPIKLWFGDADTVLDASAHPDAFATAVNALAPSTVAVVHVASAGHLAAAVYDGPAILAFFAGLVTVPDVAVLSAATWLTLARLTTSAYSSVPAGAGHVGTQWQVTRASDPTFLAIVYDSGIDAVNLTARTIPLAGLPKGVALIARARFRAQVWGGFSASVALGAISVAAPTIDVSGVPILTGSAFVPTIATDTHAASQWQVTRITDPTFIAPVFDSGTDAVNLLTVTADLLPFHVALLARARYQSASGAWSAWSASGSIPPLSPWTQTDLGPEQVVAAGMALFTYGTRGPEAGKSFNTLYFDATMVASANLGDPIRPDSLTVTWPRYVIPPLPYFGGPLSYSDGWQSVIGTGGDSTDPTFIFFDKPVRKVSVLLREMNYYDHHLRLYDKNGVVLHDHVLTFAQWQIDGPSLIYDMGYNCVLAAEFAPNGDWITYRDLVIGMDVSLKHSEWSPTDAAPDSAWSADVAPPTTVWTP